jgi:hypothetical protein
VPAAAPSMERWCRVAWEKQTGVSSSSSTVLSGMSLRKRQAEGGVGLGWSGETRRAAEEIARRSPSGTRNSRTTLAGGDYCRSCLGGVTGGPSRRFRKLQGVLHGWL